MNVAFTFAGLQALGLPDELLASFPAAFREAWPRAPSSSATAARARPRTGRRARHRRRPRARHGLRRRRRAPARRAADILDADSEHAVELVHLQRAEALDGGRDHFGFFDGIAQPALRGRRRRRRGPATASPTAPAAGASVATGEVLLGYRDEDGTLPAAPGAPFERNGTFVVYRKLAMDVAAFRRYIAEQGDRYPGGRRLLAAKIVGRWPDGTPLALSPEKPNAAISSDSRGSTTSATPTTRDGLRCPLGAHIRRANPRDADGFFDGRLSNRHRIVRRGRAYGMPLPGGALEDDGADRGLIFVCFQADIWRQFETIQALWIDDGDPFGLGRDKDFLVGEPHGTEGKMTIQGHPPFFLKPQPRFVTMRGGEYLFQPSMSALRRLAGSSGPSREPRRLHLVGRAAPRRERERVADRGLVRRPRARASVRPVMSTSRAAARYSCQPRINRAVTVWVGLVAQQVAAHRLGAAIVRIQLAAARRAAARRHRRSPPTSSGRGVGSPRASATSTPERAPPRPGSGGTASSAAHRRFRPRRSSRCARARACRAARRRFR